MLQILTVLAQIGAVFFLLISGLLLVLYNDKNKRTIKFWGKGLMFWSLASFMYIFGLMGTNDFNIAFYMLARIVLGIGFVLYLFQGTLTLLIPAKQAKTLAVVYFIVSMVLDFTYNMVVPTRMWDNIANHSVYLSMPLTIVFFAYFYTYFMKLKQNIILEMTIEWAILFLAKMFTIIVVSLGLTEFLQIIFFIEYTTMIFIAFSFDRFRKQGDTWEKVTTPKTYVIDYDLLEFMNKELRTDARPIIEKMLASHGVESISELKVSGQKEIFIDNLLNSNFGEFSPQRKAVIKTKIINLLGLNPNHWRTVDNSKY